MGLLEPRFSVHLF